MGEKSGCDSREIERTLEAVLQISAWQAELVRAALRQIRARDKESRPARRKRKT